MYSGSAADRHLADRKQGRSRHYDDCRIGRIEEGPRRLDGAGEPARRIRRAGPGPWDDFVIGGHEIRGLPLCREAYRVATEMRGGQPRSDRPVPRRVGADRSPHSSRHGLERRADDRRPGRPRHPPRRDAAADRRSPAGRSAALPAEREARSRDRRERGFHRASAAIGRRLPATRLPATWAESSPV